MVWSGVGPERERERDRKRWRLLLVYDVHRQTLGGAGDKQDTNMRLAVGAALFCMRQLIKGKIIALLQLSKDFFGFSIWVMST